MSTGSNAESTSESRTFVVHDPATGAIAGHAPNDGPRELESAVKRARRAFESWSRTPEPQLKAACAALAGVLSTHAEELAHLLTREQGKPLNHLGARWELGGAVAWAAHTAELGLPVQLLQDGAQGRVSLHRKPLGVVGSITPWNFPVMIAVWHILPALRAGNTVVLKPSPYTPLATRRMVELMNEVLPEGVLNVVTADDQTWNLGAAMAEHPDIQKLVFTGSCATGKTVMRTAAETMKRLTLELGGNDAAIVLPDADPAAVAEGLFWGAFLNNGQTCAAIKRLYVHEQVHDAVCDALVAYARNVRVGPGLEEETMLGPVQNRRQLEKVARLVDSAKQRGRVLIGGAPSQGLFYPPTLISGLDNGDALVDEEQFGPALPVIRFSDVEQAIARANAGVYGLGGSVWGSDLDAARSVALRLECGSAWLNRHGAVQPNAPFGGVKSSGFGVQFAEEGLHELTSVQVVFG